MQDLLCWFHIHYTNAKRHFLFLSRLDIFNVNKNDNTKKNVKKKKIKNEKYIFNIISIIIYMSTYICSQEPMWMMNMNKYLIVFALF